MIADPSGPPILAVEAIAKSFGGLAAVAGASFSVARGSITALIGPNGAGKTTLFDVISGYDRADAGIVRFEGAPITGLPSFRIARHGLVRTFQLTRVFAAMSVLENMLVAASEHPGEALHRLAYGGAAIRRAELLARERAMGLLRRFNLDAQAQEYAGALSGGQRKMLEFARALMVQPRLILLDEPMAGINRALGGRLLDEVEALRSTGMTFLFIEHDMDVVMRRSDTVIVMAQGKVIAVGPPALVRADRRVIDAYLGQPSDAA
jgi:neutral amino acid transport system ATP-binding protein